MGRDFSKMSPEELEAIYQANFGQSKQTQQPGIQLPSFMQASRPNTGQSVANMLSVLGGGKPLFNQGGSNLQKLKDIELKQARIDAINAGLSVDDSGNIIKAPTPLNERQQFELEQKERGQKFRTDYINESAQDMLDTIQEVKKGMDYFGPLGGLPTVASPSSLVPGEYEKRKNWEANIDKLLSGKIIEIMTEMKEASKSGGTGFGQLSNKELGVLQQASTALKRELGSQDAARYLDDLELKMRKVLSGSSNVLPNSNSSRIDDDTAYQEYLATIGQ